MIAIRSRRLLATTVAAAVAAAALCAWLSQPPPARAAASLSLPSWIKKGVVETYGEDLEDGYLGVVDTTTVRSVSGGVVSAATMAKTVGLPQEKTYPWACTEAGRCTGGGAGFQFWIDPQDALASVSGQGVPYEYLGMHSVTDPLDHQTYTVGELHYQNASGSVRTTTLYDASTGLVIEHDEVYGLEVIILWYYR